MPRKTTKPEETVTLEETKNVQTENTPEVSAPDTALPLPPATASVKKAAPTSILTLSADAEVETLESKEDTIWHELQNAYRTRKVLTGHLHIAKLNGRVCGAKRPHSVFEQSICYLPV